MPVRFGSLVVRLFTLLCLLAGGALLIGAQPRPDVPPSVRQRDLLTGRVTSASGAVGGATVSVWEYGTDSTKRITARTNDEGRWLISIPSGSGDYAVRVTVLGSKPASARALRGTPGAPITVNTRLDGSAVQLAAMKVNATVRPRAPRENLANNPASGDKQANSNDGRVAGQDLGDFAAIAASMPGVTPVDNGGASGAPGFSVAGLGANANNVTVNGMLSTNTALPRDALGTVVRVATTPWDVSRGGFSGAQVSVSLASGNNIANRVARVTLDAPSLQATDAVGRRLGSAYTQTAVSGAATGAFIIDKLFYNVSVQASRRNSDMFSLLSGDPFVLQRVGLAADSASRARTAFAGKGLPVARTNTPNDRFEDNVRLWSRIDLGSQQDTAKGAVTAQLQYTRRQNDFVGPTALPIGGGESRGLNADFTANYSDYLRGTEYLNDVFAGVSFGANEGTPYSTLPSARVLVRSDFDVGLSGIQSLQLGGSGGLPFYSRRLIAQIRDQLSWFTPDRTHRLRVGAEARRDGTTQTQNANLNGTFAYNSIADFVNDRPLSFSRTLNNVEIANSQYAGALFVGDEWNVSRRLQFVYGLRADGTYFPQVLRENKAVTDAFGVHTDYTPRLVDISPRVGFSWGFGRNGNAVPGFGAPWGTIRGGIGRFRNDVESGLLQRVQRFTGLPGGIEQFSCIGDAVPRPDWSGYLQDLASVPTTCLNGSRGSTFAITQPNVWLVDRGFRAQDTWRGALGLTGFVIPRRVDFLIEGTWSENRHLTSYTDLNFDGIARFALPGEGARPVFANVGSIVPASGALTNRDSRRRSEFGSLTSILSDTRSVAKQLTVGLSPTPGYIAGRDYFWNASYTYVRVDEALRGFTGGAGGNTTGDPRAIEWARSARTPAHQFILTASTRLFGTFSFGATANIRSGLPFTPLVNGDVNGDGVASNDRAFIFDPASAQLSETMRTGLQSLRANASARVQRCLDAQLGRLAQRSSCDAPWTADVNATIRINPSRVGMQNRLQLQMTLANLAAGMDQLLNGSGNLRGWGQPVAPDPFLLTVRGFDPSTRAYRYEVNQRFGSASIANTFARRPFMAMLDVKVVLGRNLYRQVLENAVEAGRSRKGALIDTIEGKRLMLQTVSNPIRQLIIAKDSLSILTTEQYRAFTTLAIKTEREQEEIVSPFVREISAKAGATGWNRDEYAVKVWETMVRLHESVVRAMDEAAKIFTPAQIAEFPPALQASFDPVRLKKTRPIFGIFPSW